MTTEDTTNPEGVAAAAEGAGSTAAAADADPPPSTVSLDVVQAMHDRLLKLQAARQHQADDIAALQKNGDLSGTMLQEILGRVEELHAAVVQHADIIDGLTKAVDEIASRLTAAPPRGELQRRLPPTPATAAEAEAIAQPGAFEAGKITEMVVDTHQVGSQVHTLPSGGELEIRVKRPEPAPGGMIRDGRRTIGGTRRS